MKGDNRVEKVFIHSIGAVVGSMRQDHPFQATGTGSVAGEDDGCGSDGE